MEIFQNPSVRGGAVLCRQSPWSRIAEAVVVVTGCTCLRSTNPTQECEEQGARSILFCWISASFVGAQGLWLPVFGSMDKGKVAVSVTERGELSAKCDQAGWQ